jgi:effector-binding domain-containing protein
MTQATPQVAPSPDLAGAPQLEEVHATPVAVVRFEGTPETFPELFGEALGLTATAIEAAGARIDGPPFGRYQEFGARIVVDAGFPFVGTVGPTARVRIETLPGGRVVTVTHVGSYDDLGSAWGEGQRWIDAHGLTVAGAPWEQYLTGPEDPGPTVTRVVWPVE